LEGLFLEIHSWKNIHSRKAYATCRARSLSLRSAAGTWCLTRKKIFGLESFGARAGVIADRWIIVTDPAP
jgi:hypothetical protein